MYTLQKGKKKKKKKKIAHSKIWTQDGISRLTTTVLNPLRDNMEGLLRLDMEGLLIFCLSMLWRSVSKITNFN